MRVEVCFQLVVHCSSAQFGSLFALSVICAAQNNASKCLLAIMESRQDTTLAERIIQRIQPSDLVSRVGDLDVRCMVYYMWLCRYL